MWHGDLLLQDRHLVPLLETEVFVVNSLIIIQGNHNDVLRTCWEETHGVGRLRLGTPTALGVSHPAPGTQPIDVSVSWYVSKDLAMLGVMLEFKDNGVLFMLLNKIARKKFFGGNLGDFQGCF